MNHMIDGDDGYDPFSPYHNEDLTPERIQDIKDEILERRYEEEKGK